MLMSKNNNVYEQTAPVFKMHDRYVYFRSVQIKL